MDGLMGGQTKRWMDQWMERAISNGRTNRPTDAQWVE